MFFCAVGVARSDPIPPGAGAALHGHRGYPHAVRQGRRRQTGMCILIP